MKTIITLFISYSLLVFSYETALGKVTDKNYQINQMSPSGKVFFVQDSTQYNDDFIDDLQSLESVYESIKLIGKNLIFNNTDTIAFPDMLPLNKVIIYQSIMDKKIYRLELKRINFTNIMYSFFIDKKPVKSGQVVLVLLPSPGFILGTEFSDDNKEYPSELIEYSNRINGWTSIRIENVNAKRVIFGFHCDHDSIKNIGDIPVLRRK
jgi:hypothetical protein